MKKKLISTEAVLELPTYEKLRRFVTIPHKIARKIFLKKLGDISHGFVELRDGNEIYQLGSPENEGPRVVIDVFDPDFYFSVVFGGSIGAAESYMDELWCCSDLTTLIRIMIMNRDLIYSIDDGLSWLTNPIYSLTHNNRRNTRTGSRENICAHYDLGNDFYRLFLDSTMTYSCGIFERDDSTLREASIAKIDRICRKMKLSPQDHILEIGTGWGWFAIHAASNYGCRVTTTTISREQFELTAKRIKEAGLSGRITLLFEDYRDLGGKFDRVVSIEMIEAVGHHYYMDFFDACSRLLKDNGMLILQAITIPDHIFDYHKKRVDFIKRYIFPGSCIPSLKAMHDAVVEKTDLRLTHLEDITPHYAKTLRMWRERFLARLDEVKKQGYHDNFVRMWEYYLSYCEAGFAERYLGNLQLVFTKPGCRQEPFLPSLRRSQCGFW